VAELILRI